MTLEIIGNVGRVNVRNNETIELNIVSINEGKELYDIGRWTNDRKRRAGVLMELQQLYELRDIINEV